MTDAPQRAREAATHFEARLMGFKKTRDRDGTWVEVRCQIHPNDVPEALQLADLGTRYQIAMVEIDDNEQPVVRSGKIKWTEPAKPEKPKRKWDNRKPSDQAGAACAGTAFQNWLGVSNPEDAADRVRSFCGVEKRSEFDTNSKAALRWFKFYDLFEHQTGRVAEERR